MELDSTQTPKRSLTEITYVIFLRMVAIACLWFGLQYWGMLVGLTHSGYARFDLLSLPWRTASSTLAVVFPVAALGLWLGGSWGPVIWLIAATGQALMFGVWSNIFGTNAIVLILHASVALVFIAFRLALWFEKRQARGEITVDSP
ncbi:hypothetical protein FE840_011140 [Peteryoungia desertarenae]|uniref:Transmembrane protein n=1 Tax=Peteryoungia desertarenae TaxID=1813451 RepID=A0ABX6QS93_9HYPH|nr:DUF6163 family protein [Peteryoungia desertarenae]QLF71379.1 hypothetical protein FE840_011140 [Peteryoungia desertarenae]